MSKDDTPNTNESAEKPDLAPYMGEGDPDMQEPYVPADLSFSDPEPEVQADDPEAELEDEAEDEPDDEDTVSEDVPETDESDDESEDDDDDSADTEAAAVEPEPEKRKRGRPRKKASPMVPKARLDEVLAKLKDQQKQLEQMQSLKASDEVESSNTPEYDFEAKEVEYQGLVLDGEVSKAAKLRQEIRQAEREELRRELKQEVSQTVEYDRTALALQQAASQIEEAFPFFDQNSDQFNEALTTEVVELRDAFIVKGVNPVEALTKAATYVIKANDLYEGDSGSVPALGDAQRSLDELARKRSQVQKKLEIASKQPPDMPEATQATPSGRINVMALTDKEFEELDAQTLARLRGDII